MTWVVRSARDLFTAPTVLGQWRHEDHDRAQDAFANEKLARPGNIVEMSEANTEMYFIVYVSADPDAIFSTRGDAQAWCNQLVNRFGHEDVRIEIIPRPALSWSAPPVKEAPTIWERLLNDEDP